MENTDPPEPTTPEDDKQLRFELEVPGDYYRLYKARMEMHVPEIIVFAAIGVGLIASIPLTRHSIMTRVLPIAYLAAGHFWLWTRQRKYVSPVAGVIKKTLTYEFSDSNLREIGPLGAIEFPWKTFNTLNRHTNNWYLIHVTGRRVILPSKLLDEELRQFIETQFRNNGKFIMK